MGYLTQNEIANNASMMNRIAQAAAEQNIGTPVLDADRWAYDNRRDWAAAPGWDDAWESYKASHPDDGDPETPAPDPGADEGVITDGMILSQVQAMMTPEPPA